MEQLRKFFLGSTDAKNVAEIEALSKVEAHKKDDDPELLDRLLAGMDRLHPLVARTEVASEHVAKDLELFASFSSTPTLRGILDLTHTRGAREYVKKLFESPTDALPTLQRRQRALRGVEARLGQLLPHLSALREHEADVLWLLDTAEDEQKDRLFDIAFWRTFFLRPLNASAAALKSLNVYQILVSPLVGLLTPIIYFVMPYLVLRLRFGIVVPISTFVRLLVKGLLSSSSIFDAVPYMRPAKYVYLVFAGLFYFQGLFNSVEIARAVNRVCNIIDARMHGVASFLSALSFLEKSSQKDQEGVASDGGSANKVDQHVLSDDVGADGVGADGRCWDLSMFFDNCASTASTTSCVKDVSCLVTEPDGTARKVPAEVRRVCAVWGAARCPPMYRRFAARSANAIRAREDLSNAVARAYALDALAAVAAYRGAAGLCYVDFVGGAEIEARFSGLFHPGLDLPADVRPVKNDVELSAENMLLTGPNAGGKSTLLKAVLVSCVFAQCVGVAPCDACRLKPFSYIASQINVPDCKGKESLFEAEMSRCLTTLNLVKKLAPHQTALVVMDELLSSTNPVEGISGAFAIATSLARRANVVTVLSTHFPFLTRLGVVEARKNSDSKRSRKRSFRNVKMEVVRKDDGSFDYPYRLSTGVSDQYLAIELLRLRGFDPVIVNMALRTKKALGF